MAELASTNIYGHLTVHGDVRVSSIIGKADVISIPATVLMEHADFGQQLIVKRNSANSAAAITYENSSGILGRAGFAETGTYAIYYGTSTTAAWEIDASGVLQKGTIPWSRLSSVPSYASRWPSWSEVTDKPSTFTPSSHTHAAGDITSGTIAAARLPSASTSAAGIVQLSSATNSTSTTLAATASAVKAAYDLAASKWTYNESTIKAVKVNNAVAADQLATARTINGTSFNGTANITTAKWGTARTITIGDTGKSVDGSANVSWSLSEIGVVSNHTLDLTSLNQDTYYPVTIKLPTNNFVRMRILNALNQGPPHPSWATHASGFSVLLEWSAQGSGWGTSQVTRYISRHTESFVSGKPAVGGITQMTNSSNEVVWLRGGGKYFFEADRNVTPIVRTSAYTESSQTVTPQTDVINVPSEQGRGYFGVGVLVGSVTGNATTATKLATARTINGTSFDGSANITTANWGTARTITIGNTSKSVNGSANVSWSLSEIGAEPALAANRKRQIFVQSSTPSGAQTGDIWIVT